MKLMKIFAASVTFAFAMAGQAEAAVTVNVFQSGADVVATASGSLDLTGLVSRGAFGLSQQIQGSDGYVGLGPSDASLTGFSGMTGPAAWGPGLAFDASSGAGGPFGLNASGFGSPYVFVPVGYISGAAISGMSTWLGQSFASLGLDPGTYVYSSGLDTVTVNIGGAVPEPSTWAMMLLGFGALGVAMRRRNAASLSPQLI
jgi:hypothetical protein